MFLVKHEFTKTLQRQIDTITTVLALAHSEKRLLILGIIALTLGATFGAFIPWGM